MPSSSAYDISTSARSQTSTMIGDRGEQTESHPVIVGSIDTIDDKQVVELICLENINIVLSISSGLQLQMFIYIDMICFRFFTFLARLKS